jgi:integrase
MAGEPAGAQEGDALVLAEVVNYYLEHVEQRGDQRYLRRVRQCLIPTVEKLGNERMGALKPYMVQRWLDGMKDRWNDNSRALALRYLNAAINYCVKKGRLTVNPVKNGVDRPRVSPRGEEVYLSKEIRKAIIAKATGDFALMLRVMYETGARPIEVEQVEAHNFVANHGESPRIVFRWATTKGYVWKNARKQQRDRVIRLAPELAAMIADKCQERPTGKIFRTEDGSAFDVEGNRRKNRFCSIKRALRQEGLDTSGLLPYGFRHSYITDFLLAGLSPKICADLCGTSAGEIERAYAHVQVDGAAMQRWYMSFHDTL